MGLRAMILFAVGLSFGAGCNRSAPQSTNPGRPAPGSTSAEERKALELANDFLAKHGTAWGKPLRVEPGSVEYIPGLKGEGVYVVTYPTPEHEMKVLGDRTIVVNINSGRVEFVPRE